MKLIPCTEKPIPTPCPSCPEPKTPALVPCGEKVEEPTMTPCGELPGPDPCQGPPEPTLCGGILVCNREFISIEHAWKQTGIPPHKLRFMAKTPSFEHVYYL